MFIDKIFIAFLCSSMLSGCAFAVDGAGRNPPPVNDRDKLPLSYAVTGTNTAVVGIGLDEKGIPLETVQAIILKPGQRAVFAGPDEFQIVFKNNKFPERKPNYKSEKGVISISVPKDILDRPEFKREYEKNKSVRFDYAIRINGKELDPPFIVKRED